MAKKTPETGDQAEARQGIGNPEAVDTTVVKAEAGDQTPFSETAAGEAAVKLSGENSNIGNIDTSLEGRSKYPTEADRWLGETLVEPLVGPMWNAAKIVAFTSIPFFLAHSAFSAPFLLAGAGVLIQAAAITFGIGFGILAIGAVGYGLFALGRSIFRKIFGRKK